jgi:tetratricopeptide (TPR) repeat protein
MRRQAIAAAVLVALVLGSLQFLASIALRANAQRGAWVAHVPSVLAAAIDELDPQIPLPSTLRLVFAREALARHDVARAVAEAARLSPSRDRFALEAEIALTRGDTASAIADYLAAGDVTGLQRRIDQLARRGRLDDALALEHDVVVRMRGDRTQPDMLATVSFDLGRLEQTRAYASPPGPEKHLHELRSLEAYETSVGLAPLSLNYLLAYGSQQVNLGRLDAAIMTFEGARDADPRSAAPLAALGDVALRRGNVSAARDFLERALVLDPASDAVQRLATKVRSAPP